MASLRQKSKPHSSTGGRYHMRFHTRGMLEDGRPVILKVNATDPYEAVTLARRELMDAKIDPASIVLLKVRPLAEKVKSNVYIGKPREAGTSKRGAHLRKSNGAPTTTVTPT